MGPRDRLRISLLGFGQNCTKLISPLTCFTLIMGSDPEQGLIHYESCQRRSQEIQVSILHSTAELGLAWLPLLTFFFFFGILRHGFTV